MKSTGQLVTSKGTLVLVILLSLLVSACGSESAPASPAPTEVAQAPADTQVPPTDTLVPPIDTPVAPTDTPIPPTATPVPPTDTPEPTETPDRVATEVAVQKAAAATMTAEAPVATDTPPATDTATTTPTEAASPTAAITNTPKPPPKPKVGKILFTSNRVSWDDVFVMNDDGTEIKQLTKRGKCYDARFASNGTTIVFEHDNDIWKMSADGSNQTNLTNTADKIEAFPVIAPDGTRIAYLFGWPGGFEIYTMKMDATDQKPITSRDIDWMPAWSPDSKRITFSSLRSGSLNIWVVNRDGSGLRQVTQFGPERIAISPVVSPDGNRIAFTTLAAGTAWEIWAVNLDGSNPHKVVGTVGQDQNNSTNIVAWRQGKFLIAGWEGNWDPYFVPEGGGELVRVISGEKDDKPSDWWVP